jgi:hypothetical protein
MVVARRNGRRVFYRLATPDSSPGSVRIALGGAAATIVRPSADPPP